MRLADFDFHLPPELIAQEPLADRAGSRMLVVDRGAGTLTDRTFRDLPSYLGAGDCLVLNNSRVFPCRLFARRGEWQVEVFLLRPQAESGVWTALTRPAKRAEPGARLYFKEGVEATVIARGEYGERTLRFAGTDDVIAFAQRAGHVPLPPYIHRSDTLADRSRYQTVFAARTGSVAAPTAGLHFTPEMLGACRAAGAAIAEVTLHVGLGTFAPLRDEQVETGKLHNELFEIDEEAAERLRLARRRMAVGTTSVRTLEHASKSCGLKACSGETDIFIFPGFEFRATGAMLTNFHLPKSSLLLLVCAFGGTELVLDAYALAVRERYRFYSYGDCMLLI